MDDFQKDLNALTDLVDKTCIHEVVENLAIVCDRKAGKAAGRKDLVTAENWVWIGNVLYTAAERVKERF